MSVTTLKQAREEQELLAQQAQEAPRRWRKSIVGHADVPPDQLLSHPLNWKIHTAFQQESLAGALDTVGWIKSVTVNIQTGCIIDGHARVTLALREGESTVPVEYVDLSEAEEKVALATADALVQYAVTDPHAYAHLMADVEQLDIADERMQALFETIRIDNALDEAMADDTSLFGVEGRMRPNVPAETGPPQPSDASAEDPAPDVIDDTVPPKLGRGDVPDALWPTDNDWGVPLLNIAYQADAVDLPVTKWGTVKRHGGGKMPGTWHFYTDDYKFSHAAWGDPTPIVNSGCVSVVEPNYSTNNQMPAAVALWGVYRKRWVSSYWQSRGIRIFVDLNVEPEFDAINLLGVPKGWRAYATRYRVQDEEHVLRCFDVAKAHASSDDILFLVVGGREAARLMAQQHGWVYCPENSAEARGQFGLEVPKGAK